MNEFEIMQQPAADRSSLQQTQKKKVEPSTSTSSSHNIHSKLLKLDDRLQKIDDCVQKLDKNSLPQQQLVLQKLDENFRQQQQLMQMVQTMQLQINTLMHMVQMRSPNTNHKTSAAFGNNLSAFGNPSDTDSYLNHYVAEPETQGPQTAPLALEVNHNETPGLVMPCEGSRRFPKRTYTDFRKNMRKEMLIHNSDIENIRKDYTRVFVNIFIRHVEKERADGCDAPIKCGSRKSDLYIYEKSEKDPEGTQKVWNKMESKHIDALAQRIMSMVNIHHDHMKDENGSMNQTTESITHHMQVGKEIMEGIDKTSFQRTFKPQLYEALYAFGAIRTARS